MFAEDWKAHREPFLASLLGLRDTHGQALSASRLYQRFLSKPHYVFRPTQLIRRMAGKRTGVPISEELELATMPWGLQLAYEPSESMGSGISRTGVFDLLVTEALYRLTGPGELALDVGANLGYMTSVMASRLGPEGKILAFEPHPKIASQLQQNVGRWAPGSAAQVEIIEAAVSSSEGTGVLAEGPDFGGNRGTATLDASAAQDAASTHSVRLVKIDDFVHPTDNIGVFKLDVEGHELSALEGAAELLSAHRVRDVVFEDLEGYPTPVTEMLEAAGYRVFLLDHRLRGPTLLPPTTSHAGNLWTVDSYVATLDTERAKLRMSGWGWRSLR